MHTRQSMWFEDLKDGDNLFPEPPKKSIKQDKLGHEIRSVLGEPDWFPNVVSKDPQAWLGISFTLMRTLEAEREKAATEIQSPEPTKVAVNQTPSAHISWTKGQSCDQEEATSTCGDRAAPFPLFSHENPLSSKLSRNEKTAFSSEKKVSTTQKHFIQGDEITSETEVKENNLSSSSCNESIALSLSFSTQESTSSPNLSMKLLKIPKINSPGSLNSSFVGNVIPEKRVKEKLATKNSRKKGRNSKDSKEVTPKQKRVNNIQLIHLSTTIAIYLGVISLSKLMGSFKRKSETEEQSHYSKEPNTDGSTPTLPTKCLFTKTRTKSSRKTSISHVKELDVWVALTKQSMSNKNGVLKVSGNQVKG